MKHCILFFHIIAVFALTACDDELLSLNDTDEPVATTVASPFSRAATDTLSQIDFRRTYGVGYSYDGIYGERCNLQDVHCRVLDLNAIRAWEEEESWHEQLFTLSRLNEYTTESQFSYSRSQYVQQSVLHADVKGQMLVFNGEAQADMTMWEKGDVNNLYLKVVYTAPGAAVDVSAPSVSALITEYGHEDLLAPNFREAVAWLQSHKDVSTIDSFLTRYGSHVVTHSRVGGSLTLTMSMDSCDYTEIQAKKVLGEVAIKGILNSKTQTEEEKKELLKLDKAECSVEICGGDLSMIPNHLLNFKFSSRPNLGKYVESWAKSINFDSQNPLACNLEMTDMEITPIWDFIADEDVAKLVEARVKGTAADLNELLGQYNFVNTSFKMPNNVTCRMGGVSTTFNQPSTTNIIAAGRIVATVCREQLMLPDNTSAGVQVVYPVYEGSVNLRCGYCTYGDKAYSVGWEGDKYYVEQLGEAVSDTVWLNLGQPSSTHFDNLIYQPNHAVVGYEWPGAIKKDGNIASSNPYYLVYKQNGKFLLRTKDGKEQNGLLDALPNWSYVGGRMVRDNNYKYYWNPNEVNY